MLNRRIIVLSVLPVLAAGAALAAYRYFTPVQGQFGTGYIGATDEEREQLCGMPLEGAVPDDPATINVNEYQAGTRGPVFREGCMVQGWYGSQPEPTLRSETCQLGPCDGRHIRNGGGGLSYYSWTEEVGPCDYPITEYIKECGERETDRELQRGENCTPPDGHRTIYVESHCCENSGYNSYNPLNPVWPTPAWASSSQATQEELDQYTYNVHQPCAEGLTCQSSDWGYGGVAIAYKCNCAPGTQWDAEDEACVPIPGVTDPECGNGIKEAGEQCDRGDKNVDSVLAGKSWLDIGPGDIAELSKSGCLDTCTVAKCSDGKDNDEKNGADGQDRSCYGGAWGNENFLAGYNVEDCPYCQRETEQDDTQLAQSKSLLLTAAVKQWQSNEPGVDQQYCKGGGLTVKGNRCECSTGICFAEPETDEDGTIIGLGSCECQSLNTTEPQMWTWSCKSDRDCSQNYRCAFYATYHFLSFDDIDIYRCKRLEEDGDDGCRSRWDCKSNYTSTTQVNGSGVLPRKNSPKTKCLEINQGTARCCNPDGSDMRESCRRPNYPAQTNRSLPQFEQCGGTALPCPQGMEAFCAGGLAGGGGNDGGDGGDGGNNGSNGSSGSNSSGLACFNRNPCLASTFVNSGRTTGTWMYTIPAQCPLTGNQRTCYNSCVATLNSQMRAGNSSAQANFSRCMQNTCRVDEDDLNMCPCNADFSQCFFGCADEMADCRALCNFDSNPTACRTECTNQQRSCIDSCGRQCPASASSVANSNRSGASSSRSTSGGSSTSNRSDTPSSRSSSRSNTSSQGSNGTTGGDGGSSGGSQNSSRTTSGSSQSSQKSQTSESRSSKSGTSSSRTSGSSTSRSQGSSSSVPPQGVCCEVGNCNPFGTCSNPFPNYNACTAACGGSSASSIRSSSTSTSRSSSSRSSSSLTSSRSSSSSSRSSSSRSSSSSSSSLSRSSSSSSSSSRSSSSSSSSSSRSSSSQSSSSRLSRSSDQSTGTISGTTGIGGDTLSGIDGTTGGTTGTTSSRSFYGFNSSSLITKDTSCTSDLDCGPSARCVLNRCLTVTDIAALPPFCGNARLDAGEQCDDGTSNADRPNVPCRTDCTVGRCSDGIVDTPLEQCDDGNQQNGDGCSSICLPERTAPTTLPAQVVELPFGTDGGQGATGDSGASGNTSGIGGITKDPSTSGVPSTPDTGPAALAIMIAGGAAGWLYRRR